MYVKDCENTKFRKQICEQIEKEIAKNKDKQPTYEQLSDLLSVCHEEYLENIICDSEYWFPKTDYIKNKCFELLSKTNEPKFGELYEKTLLFESPVRFDSYMLYLEKDREPQNKFYAPKKRCLTKLGLIHAIQDMEEDKLDILSISMPPGSGKAGSLDSKVLTPSGFVEMRDIKVGSKVISGTGKVSNVLGVFPQGKKPIYEVIFNDGSKTKCSIDHLWQVQTRDDRNRGKGFRVIPLSDMLKNFRVESGKRANYSVEYVPKIDCFEKKELKLNPYVIGCLLGDGCICSDNMKISTPDKQLLDKFKSLLPDGCEVKHISSYDYNISGCYPGRKSIMKSILSEYGLLEKKSIEKHIPEDYLYSSHNDRLWLLRGLLDTDGWVDGKCIGYASSSKQLAYDVRNLVHSLGGYASVNKHDAGYKDSDGNYIKCNDCYRLCIQFSAEHENPFYIERKASKYNPKRTIWKRYIEDIMYIGEEECQCIYIDDESHLYITDDYIITHNTTLEKFFASWVIGRHPDDYSLFYSHSGDITRMFYDGVLDIVSSDEYKWQEIFPRVKLTATNAKLETINFERYKPFPNLQCTSVGAKNSGKVRTNCYLYCDDLIGGIEEAMNKSRLDSLWNIYSVDAKQRKVPGSKEIHIATRWSVHDVIGRIQRLYDGRDRVKFIAVPDIDPETGESNFDYDYNGFSVEFFNDQALSMDEVSYRCLYKNEPIEREGLLFTEYKVRRYLNLPDGDPDEIIAQCDTKSKGTDFMVMPVMYRYGDDYYCVDTICNDGADFELQYESLADMLVHHEVNACEFERNMGGDRVASEVNKRVEEKGWICNITDMPTETNKEARIFQCSNWVMQHILFKDATMYSPQSDYGVMMSQLFSYSITGKNPHDDVPDVFSNFALRMTRGQKSAKAEVFDRRMLGF